MCCLRVSQMKKKTVVESREKLKAGEERRAPAI